MLFFSNTIIFLFCLISLMFFSKYANKISFLDNPNHRSSHSKPTPKSSGVIISIFVTIIFIFYSNLNFYIYTPIILFCILGLIDDIYDIKPTLKFFFQALITSFIFFFLNKVSYINYFDSSFINYLFFLSFSLYFMNIFNFMDGIDGLAASQSLFFILSLLIIHKFNLHNIEITNELFFLLSILSAQLVINYTKYKIFLGDSGSLYISNIIIILFFIIFGENINFLSIFIIIFIYFIFDTTLTIFRRLKNY